MFALSLIGTLLFSCNDDDDVNADSNSTNYFKVADTEFELNAGYMSYWGAVTEGSYGFMIDLISDGFTVIDTSSYDTSSNYAITSGEGDLLEFYLYSSSGELEEGNYKYSDNDDNDAGTYDFAICNTNYNFEEETYDRQEYIKSGTISVIKDKSEYIFNYNCVTTEGDSLTGYYKGELYYSDYSNLYSTDNVQDHVEYLKSKKKLIFAK